MASYLLYLRHISLVALSRSVSIFLSVFLFLSLTLSLSFSCTHSLSLSLLLFLSLLFFLSFRCTVLARTLPWIWISRRGSCSRSVHITSHHITETIPSHSLPLPHTIPYSFHSPLIPFPLPIPFPPSFSFPPIFPFTIISSSPFPFPSNLSASTLSIHQPPSLIF